MPKIIILNNCSGCPHKVWDRNNQKRVCMLSGYRVIDTAVTTIPGWCELEDYPEVPNEAETETNPPRETETI